MLKGTKLYSVLFNKCPHCHEGDFFITKNPYDLKNFEKIHAQCPNCKKSFMKEVGFYYGSMYASYGLTIALGLTLFLVMCVVFELPELVFLISFCIIALLLWTWIFRTARLLWINLFVRYELKQKNE